MKKIIVWASIILLSALFVYAAYNKLAIYSVFVSQLHNSPVTGGYENILAWFVPGIEILIVLLLLIKRTRFVGFYSAFFLMLIFTVYVYVVPHFFEQHTCACGGIISTFTWKQHFYFNLFFTLLAGTGVILYPYIKTNKLTKNIA